MVFVLVLCGLVIGVYFLLIALLLVAGFYGVFGAIVYGPFFIIRYIWRVFDGEDALEKSYDVRKPKKLRVREPREVSNVRLTDRKTSKIKKVREPREVSNVRLTDRKPSKIKKVAEAKKPAVKVVQVLKPKKASNTVESNKPPRLFQPKKSVSIKPSANKLQVKVSVAEVSHNAEPQKANQHNAASKKANPRKPVSKKPNPRNAASKKANPRKVEPQGITPNIPTTSSLTDYQDMV